MGSVVGLPLSQAQRARIEAKIRGIAEDADYLARTGIPVPVNGGNTLSDSDFQRRRAELLQQVLDTNDVSAIMTRAEKTLAQARALTDAGEKDLGEERRLQALLLRWAVEPI